MESTRVENGKILITGGAGVLGGYLASALKDEYEGDIVVADVTKPDHAQGLRFVRLDLREPFTLSNDFEVCIHLAAYVGGIQYFTKHPVENIRDNPRMTANMLDATLDSKVEQVIYTSSSVVYQHQTKFPTTEESVLESPPPSSAYGMSKLVGEFLCKAYNEQFGLRYTILRPFNIYGPREAPDPDYAHVIPELIRKVLSNKVPIEVYGSGEQTRTFTHGRDVAAAYNLAIKNKQATDETFNVSGNEEIKIMDVLKAIWELTGHTEELKTRHLPPFPHDVQRRFPSNRKIMEKLGWQPTTNFREGLLETIESIQDKVV